ncbi:hypothetical protein [Salinactinospora qingdaonensis]|uniref:Uncharacterized protein n=1 Tax=Salinactinospora qingdaonensis TaxID=702744 RepID=A0ABP7ET52_9ACTN
MSTSASPTRFEAATRALAADVTRALRDHEHPFPLERRVAALDEQGSGPGAVRVLGTDVLAPFVLSGRLPDPGDVAVVRAAVRAFPAPPATPAPDPLWAARDWALYRVLRRFGVDASEWEGLCLTAVGGSDTGPGLSEVAKSQRWPAWCASLAQLTALALPGLDSAVRAETLAARVDLTRGLARSMLRRDHLTAARLARWLALDTHAAAEPLLDPALKHLELLSADQPRVLLELALARRITETEH